MLERVPTRGVCLAVPASNTRALRKARELDVDEVIIDLEDSVAPPAKATARAAAVAALNTPGWRTPTRSVRVNPVCTPEFQADIQLLIEQAEPHIASIVLPKVERRADVERAGQAIERLTRTSCGLPLQALIESARGVAEVERIADASAWLQTLVFGPGDFAASLGIPGFRIGATTAAAEYALCRVVIAARAYGPLQAIDGPYAAIDDPTGLAASAETTRGLGYDGKWIIHPRQAVIVRQAFTPTSEELERAKQLLGAYERATAAAQGAARFNGEMIDAVSAKFAERLIERAARGGDRETPPSPSA
jgi:citrate lyase subunit beta / citryl-CoA lyase